jgi:hypothetical protein
LLRAQASALPAAADGLMPLDFLLGVMRDSEADPGKRFEAAKAAAPYLHPKLAAIEHSGRAGGPIETRDYSKIEVQRRTCALIFKVAKGEYLLREPEHGKLG